MSSYKIEFTEDREFEMVFTETQPMSVQFSVAPVPPDTEEDT